MNNCDNNSSEPSQTEDENFVDEEDESFTSVVDLRNDKLADLIVEKLLSKLEVVELLSNKVENNQNQRSFTPSRNRQTGQTDSPKYYKPKTFFDFVSSEDHLKKLDSRFEFANKYLNLVKLTNHQILNDVDGQYFPTSYFNKSESQVARIFRGISEVTLLNRIEKFMLTLGFKPLYAFAEEKNWQVGSITPVGREFIYLLSEAKIISKFNHPYLTGNVKIFINFIHDRPISDARFGFDLKQHVTEDSIIQLNDLLRSLRASIIQGRYDKAKIGGASRNWHRNRGGVQFRDFKKLEDNIKYLLSKGEDIKLQLKPDQLKDIAIFRFQIEISRNRKSLRYEPFSKFFTELIKKAKTPNGLPGLLAHVNVWKEFDNQLLRNDMILFFDANRLTTFDRGHKPYFLNLISEIRRLSELVFNSKANDTKSLYNGYKVYVHQIPILSEFSSGNVWILDTASTRWKDVYDKLIPYFYMMGSYERTFTDVIKNRTTGSRDRTENTEEKSKDKKSGTIDPKKTKNSTKS